VNTSDTFNSINKGRVSYLVCLAFLVCGAGMVVPLGLYSFPALAFIVGFIWLMVNGYCIARALTRCQCSSCRKVSISFAEKYCARCGSSLSDSSYPSQG
jgi:hypothetical protein